MVNTESSSMACAKQVVETVPILIRVIRASVRADGGSLSLPQLRALGFVNRNPGASVSDVGNHLDVTIPSASALIDRLVKKDLIERVDDPNERRKVLLTITAKGSTALEESRTRAQTIVAHLLSAETPEQISTISQGLALLAEAAQSFAVDKSKL
jgi:DNA-binding MarR family transcriptional regulator